MGLGAALYTSVGHAGASSYIALMALFSVPAATMRPTALALNIVAAMLAVHRYGRAGLIRWRAVWPFMTGAVPFAFIGGGIQIPGQYYRPLVGAVLILTAVRLLWIGDIGAKRPASDPPVWGGIAIGAAIGLLAGLTGTGGGIFLSPVIVFMGWASIRTASGCAAAFILGNSIAGLLGNVAAIRALPEELPVYVVAVILGALVGTTLGTRLPARTIQRVLAVVLLIAGAKLFGVY